ncbi:RDD family protein [Azohydromonas caseinilytica]|nr:RDD family protein [Azohydromonas caseinilytica]
MSAAAPAAPQTPGLPRRLACMVYEGVLLFGVLMLAGFVYSTLAQQRHALQGRQGLLAFLFVVLGLYFVWFWSHGGQTVAMKAWHIRLVDAHGQPVSPKRALCRYLLSWIWFLPALVAAQLAHLTHSAGTIFGLLSAGVLAYALLALVQPRRQYWHDHLCGTQLVISRPAPRKKR